MGTWDVGSFGNDTAADWAIGLEEADNLSYVQAALDRVASAEATKPVPSEAAEEAIAAAEVVARLRGQWGEEDAYSAPADEWVRANPFTAPSALVEKAVAVLDRVLTPPSELLELWEETDEAGAWIQAVRELRGRLKA